jgi:hypothetical protein
LKTLIDGRSYQAALHMGTIVGRPEHTGRRLNGFLAIVESVLGEPARISDAHLTAKQLAGVDLLVILTRRRDGPSFQFSHEEYRGIEGHLESGGALLLMTNHAPFAENDRKLIGSLGRQQGVSVYRRKGLQGQGAIRVDGDCIKPHPVTEGVRALTFGSSHILTCRPRKGASILATIPGRRAPNNVFALAIDGPGRVALGADSGFICDESDEGDSGYIEHEDNRRYARQLLEWLCRKR